jgi:hypothetical protein
MEHLRLQIPLAFGDLAYFRESGNLQDSIRPRYPQAYQARARILSPDIDLAHRSYAF